MSTSIQFLGGAGTVTGSKFLLESTGKRLLVDCGLFQGLKELRLRNWAPFEIPAASIDAVLLTHAHLDHCGYLPLLVRNGFSGPIYCTGPTRDLAKIILTDSAKIQEEDAEAANVGGYTKHSPAKPLYEVADVQKALRLFRLVRTGEWIELFEGLKTRFTNSGHILGSAIIEVQAPNQLIAFTGDLGRSDPLILNPPEILRRADTLVIESTYGDRIHSPMSPLKELARVICETVERRGHLIIPSFAVGRAQDVIYLISELKRRSQIMDIPVFLDSPMGINATELLSDYPAWHRLTPDESHELYRTVTMVRSKQQSDELLARRDSSIVIAGSGMLSGGRVLTHLEKRLPDDRNAVALVGYQPPGTRGSQLERGASEVKIHGRYVPVRAKIEVISTLSAHADQKDMVRWLSGLETAPKNLFIVHGEPQAADALRVRVKDEFGWSARVPAQGAKFELA